MSDIRDLKRQLRQAEKELDQEQKRRDNLLQPQIDRRAAAYTALVTAMAAKHGVKDGDKLAPTPGLENELGRRGWHPGSVNRWMSVTSLTVDGIALRGDELSCSIAASFGEGSGGFSIGLVASMKKAHDARQS